MSLFHLSGMDSHFNEDTRSIRILDAGLIAAGKESKQGRQTVFFVPLDPWRDETEEEFDGDIIKVENSSLSEQVEILLRTLVYWIHVAKAQEKTLTFWQTRSHVIITFTIQCQLIVSKKMVSENGEKTL